VLFKNFSRKVACATIALQKSHTQEIVMGELLQPWHLILLFFIFGPFTVVVVPPFWMIFKKAGFQPILSLLMLVPLVNLAMLYIVAFSNWKANHSVLS
jgi:hypothetical protein